MNGKNRLDGFDLDDHLLIHEQIDSITSFDDDAVVDHGKNLFAFNSRVHSLEFMAEAYLVGPFEQPRSQLGMHSVSGTDNAVAGFAVYKPSYSVVRGRGLRVGAFDEQRVVQE